VGHSSHKKSSKLKFAASCKEVMVRGAKLRLVSWLIFLLCRKIHWEDLPQCVYFADELVNEKEKYKSITDELDMTFSELSGY